MQTFVPYPHLRESVACLDNKRLGNQVYREGLTLLNGGWANHPASKMWRGHEHHLALYCLAGACEMQARVYKGTGPWKESIADKWTIYFAKELKKYSDTGLPCWWGNEAVHISHQSNLLRKDPWHYSQFFNVRKDIPYVWPESAHVRRIHL